MLITITNLYPRPDQPTRGMFNAQLFKAMAKIQATDLRLQTREERSQGAGGRSHKSAIANHQPSTVGHLLNICLVPEWRVWRWRDIRLWDGEGRAESAKREADNRQQTTDLGPCSPVADGHQSSATSHAPRTIYLPVFYVPLIGRSVNWWFCYRAVRGVWRDIRRQASGNRCQAKDRERAPSEARSASVGQARSTGPGQGAKKIDDAHDKGAECTAPLAASRLHARCFPSSGPEACGLPPAVSCLASWLYPDGVAVARALRGTGARLWLMALGSDTFHVGSTWRRRRIVRSCKDAEGVVCVARVLADRLVSAGVPREKLHVVPNGVDASLFRFRGAEELSGTGLQTSGSRLTSEVRNEYAREEVDGTGGGGKGKMILFVANLVPVKGPDVMIRAFARMVDHFLLSDGGLTTNSPCLVIIGSGPVRKAMERQADQLGISGRIHFLGTLPHTEVALWMNRADVLCLTSRSEGMPNVVVEALTSGLPVVATDVGACRQMLEGEPAARLCRSDDTEGLAQALHEVLAMKVDRKAMAAKYAGKYSWDRMAGDILQLIRDPGRV